jgi:2-polyprenyl-3-methyl-5-hydroxy-6-metoxy-1,4-benzoquinol methylase/GNAT superfamily N-acetyltransferase
MIAKSNPASMFEFHWAHGPLLNSGVVSEMSELYSNHYGTWGPGGYRPGQPIRLPSDQIRRWLVADSLVVWAEAFGKMIGYAIAIHAPLAGHGPVAWITQLVVHRDHRQVDVGKRLLFTIWKFTDYFAWGILSANPYAVRALEKATRRRCQPALIARHANALLALGRKHIHYLEPPRELVVNPQEARINTSFHLDHSGLTEMILRATDQNKPWTLGNLSEGWEWFAFTFHDQAQIALDESELHEMLEASDRITKQAYARMQSQWHSHGWAKHAPTEVELMLTSSGIAAGASVLDFGCGDGRHTLEFARRGYRATGVDYLHESIDTAREALRPELSRNARFHFGDCRTTDIGGEFDLGICLYDVIGSYADNRQNISILANLAKHICPGGHIFISVMNMELTARLAKNWFSISAEPDRLLTLPPSDIMEKSGNIFNPEFYLIDRDEGIVYRKEQFRKGEELFEELLVRDRRYTQDEITQICAVAGLEVIWTRFVCAGNWDGALARESEMAKEILVMCRKAPKENLQKSLFE